MLDHAISNYDRSALGSKSLMNLFSQIVSLKKKKKFNFLPSFLQITFFFDSNSLTSLCEVQMAFHRPSHKFQFVIEVGVDLQDEGDSIILIL